MTIENNRSIVDVLQDILGNLQNLIRSEIQLAKAELKEEATKASRAAILVVAGAVAGIFAVQFLLVTAFFALGIVIPYWAAALVVFAITAVLALALISAGKERFQTVHPTPEKTIGTVKENVEWMKHQAK